MGPATPNLLVSPENNAHNGARRLDPVTGDYVLDSRGRALGMTEAQQVVALALTTTLNSSAMIGLGNDFRTIKTITADYRQRLTDIVTRALSNAVARGLVQIVSITPERFSTSGLFVSVRWRDLSTGNEQTTQV